MTGILGSHPGGLALTKRLLSLSEACPPASVLDLGAGNGETVRYLKEQGFDVLGVDLKASGTDADVLRQDMTGLTFADGAFDLCIAECSVSVCGDGPLALREAYRVLKPGGSFLLSDVFFQKEEAPKLSMPKPLRMECWEREFEKAGFRIRMLKDETALWKEFFLESLWNDNADPSACEFFRKAGRAGCGYFLAWLQKGGTDGFI